MSYDTKCYDLAKLFLEDEPALDCEDLRRQLAQEIQDAIESFFEDARRNLSNRDHDHDSR